MKIVSLKFLYGEHSLLLTNESFDAFGVCHVLSLLSALRTEPVRPIIINHLVDDTTRFSSSFQHVYSADSCFICSYKGQVGSSPGFEGSRCEEVSALQGEGDLEGEVSGCKAVQQCP